MATENRAIKFLTARNGKGFEVDVVDVEEMKRQKAMADLIAKQNKKDNPLKLDESTVLSAEAEERVKQKLLSYNFADAFAKLELIPEPEPVGIEESLAKLGMLARKKKVLKSAAKSSDKGASPTESSAKASPVLEISPKTDGSRGNSPQILAGHEFSVNNEKSQGSSPKIVGGREFGVIHDKSKGNSPNILRGHEFSVRSPGNSPKMFEGHEFGVKNEKSKGNSPNILGGHEFSVRSPGNSPKIFEGHEFGVKSDRLQGTSPKIISGPDFVIKNDRFQIDNHSPNIPAGPDFGIKNERPRGSSPRIPVGPEPLLKDEGQQGNYPKIPVGPEPLLKIDTAKTGHIQLYEVTNENKNFSKNNNNDNLDPDGMPKLDPNASHPGSFASQKTDPEATETRSVKSNRKTPDTLSARSGKKTPASGTVSASQSARSTAPTESGPTSYRSSARTLDPTASGSTSYKSGTKTPQPLNSASPSYRSSSKVPETTASASPSYRTSSRYPETTTSASPSYRSSSKYPETTTSASPSYRSSSKYPETTASASPSYKSSSKYPQTATSASPSYRSSSKFPETTASASPSFKSSSRVPETTTSASPSYRSSSRVPDQAASRSPSYKSSSRMPETTTSKSPSYRSSTKTPVPTASGAPSGMSSRKTLASGSRSGRSVSNKSSMQPSPGVNQGTGSSRQVTAPSTSILKIESPSSGLAQPRSAVSWAGQKTTLVASDVLDTPRMTVSKGSALGSQANIATQANLDPSSIGLIDATRRDGYGTPSTIVSPVQSGTVMSQPRVVETTSGMPLLIKESSPPGGTPSHQVNLNPSELKVIESPPTTIESPGVGTQANFDPSTINYFAGPDAQRFKATQCQTDFSLTPTASQASTFEDIDAVYDVGAQTSFDFQSGVFWEDLDSKVEFEFHEEDQSTISEEKPKKKFPARLFLDDDYLFGPLRPVGETVKPWPLSAQEPIEYEKNFCEGCSRTSIVTQQGDRVYSVKSLSVCEEENNEEKEPQEGDEGELQEGDEGELQEGGEGDGEVEADVAEELADGVEMQDKKSSLVGSKRGSFTGSRSSQRVEKSESKIASNMDTSVRSKRGSSINNKDISQVEQSGSGVEQPSKDDVKSLTESEKFKHTASETSLAKRKSDASQGSFPKASVRSTGSVAKSQSIEEEEDFLTENMIPGEEKNINPFLDDCHLLGPLKTIEKDHKASWDRELLVEKREPDPNFIEHEMGIVLMDLASKHPQPIHTRGDDEGEPPYDPCNFLECPKDLISYSKLHKKVDFVDDAELAAPLRTVGELSSLYHDPFALYTPMDSCHWRLGEEDTPESSKESLRSERSFRIDYEESSELDNAPMVLPPVEPRNSFLDFAKKMSIEEPEHFFEEPEDSQGDQAIEHADDDDENTGCFGSSKSKKKTERRPIFNPGGKPATEEENIELDEEAYHLHDDKEKLHQPTQKKKKNCWMCSLCCAKKQESHQELPTSEKEADKKDAENKEVECEHPENDVSCFGKFREKCCSCCGRKESVPVVLLVEEEDEMDEEEKEHVVEYIEMDTYNVSGDRAEPPSTPPRVELPDGYIPYRKYPRVKGRYKEGDLPSCGNRFSDLAEKPLKEGDAVSGSGSQHESMAHSSSCTCTTCTDEQEWFERCSESESRRTVASNTTMDSVKGYYDKERKRVCGPPFQPCMDRFVVDFKPGFKMTLKIGCSANDCPKENSYFMSRSLLEEPDEGPLYLYQSSEDPNSRLVHEGGDCNMKAATYSLQKPNLAPPCKNRPPRPNLKEKFSTEEHIVEVLSTNGDFSVDEYIPADNHRDAVEYTQEELHVDSSLPIIDIDAHFKFMPKKSSMVYPTYNDGEPTKAFVLDMFDASNSVLGNGEDLVLQFRKSAEEFADPKRFRPQLYVKNPPPEKPAPKPPKPFNPWGEIDNCTIPDWSYFRYDPKDPYTIDYSSDVYWLTCRRCKKRFKENNKPIQLKCGHWLCRPCIEDLMEGKLDSETFPCFQCKTKIEVPQQRFKHFKVCYFINNLRIVTEAMEKIEGISCPNDKGHGEATHRCRYCRSDFCGTCAADHHIKYPEHITGTRVAILLEEAREVLPKPPIYCQQHETKEITHYCNQCKKPVCEECYITCARKKGHDLRRIENFVPYARYFITTYLKEQLTIAIQDADHMLQELAMKKKVFASQYQYNSFSRLEGRKRQGHHIVDRMKNKLISEIETYMAGIDRNMKMLERDDIFHKIKLFEIQKFIILVKSIAYDDELNKLTDTVFDNILHEAIRARDILHYKSYIELQRIAKPHFKYGMELGKSKLVKKFRAMPYPIDKIAIGNDTIVCLHFSQLLHQERNSVVVVLTKNAESHQLWMKMIASQCPTARDLAFVNIHEKSQKLAIITDKEDYDEPGTCKQHCITLINPVMEPPVIKYIMKNQKPLGVVNNPTPGFYYAHGCPPASPIQITHWRDDGDIKTIYDAGDTCSIHDPLQHIDYMCANSKGHVIICDRKLNKLVLIEETGLLYRQDMTPHYKSDIPPKPCGICVDKNDNIYVVQTPNHVVLRYGYDLTFKDVYLTQYDGLKEPISIAIMGNYLVIGSLDGTISFYEIDPK